MLMFDSIPKAANAMPYISANENDVNIIAHSTIIARIVELYPRARPWMMEGAAPPVHDYATSLTGACEFEV